jgi:hypothetical protein
MFKIGNQYSFYYIKDKLEVKDGNSMLRKGKTFVGLCLEDEVNFIQPNIILVKNGSLIRKIGRDLAAAKYPIKLFFKGHQQSKYEYVGETEVIETKTAPKKVKSTLEGFTKMNPKDFSRLVYLNMPK